jgi:hypothetical protein
VKKVGEENYTYIKDGTSYHMDHPLIVNKNDITYISDDYEVDGNSYHIQEFEFGGYPSTQLPQRAPAVYMNPVDSLYNLYNLD